jgi:hypothetical protein
VYAISEVKGEGEGRRSWLRGRREKPVGLPQMEELLLFAPMKQVTPSKVLRTHLKKSRIYKERKSEMHNGGSGESQAKPGP